MSVFTRAPHTKSLSSLRSMMVDDIPNDDGKNAAEKQEPMSIGHQQQGQPHTTGSERREPAPIHRLVERDLPYHQSMNSLRVRHQTTKPVRFFHWYVEDWFHVLLRFRTIVSIAIFVAIWTSFLLLFSGIYVAIDRNNPNIDCGLGTIGNPITFYTAFAFSLETTTTVGYGLPNSSNAFFANCKGLQVAIYFQMLVSMFLNAFLLSFVFARLSRCEARAAQVLFSNKAVLKRDVLANGTKRYMLSVRVYDADSMYPIVEAHVRFYAVKHGSMHAKAFEDVRHPMKMEPMRVTSPNDDLGAVLYTSIPTCATHHIDYHSPILPPSKRRLGPEDGRVLSSSGFVLDPCGMDLREHDSYTGSQDGLRCVVCGETYTTVVNLIQHIQYNQHMERHDDVPVIGSHQELDVKALFKDRSKRSSPRTMKRVEGEMVAATDSGTNSGADTKIDIDLPAPWYEEYRAYLKQANIEIICVVEAIDPIMSGTFQALQSYTIDDIEFGAEFAPCILADKEGGKKDIGRLGRWFVGRSAVGRSVKVDLDSFHDVVNVPETEKIG